MSDSYPNEGPDSRLDLFGILKWLQNALSYHSENPPRWLIRLTGSFTYWVPTMTHYVTLGLAWPPYFIVQWARQDGRIVPVPVSPEHPDGLKWEPGKVAKFRVGWRYDPNWEGGGYIFPTAAVKSSMPHPMEKGY